jgi:hypothetical protein
MSYYQFKDSENNEYGSFEVFYDIKQLTLTGKPVDAGFYWWACFPGCMPDGDPIGPFQTEEEAIEDAQNS